jgi:hypothetical protein
MTEFPSARSANARVNLQPSITTDRATTSVRPAVLLWTFSVTLFLSAFLLFSVEPLFAKLALPKLGGAPSVWAVSLCFFQGTLLAGYCYAYAIIRWFPPRTVVFMHATLLLVTLAALPIGLTSVFGEPEADNSYLWLLCELATGVGLPFFAVAANAPLLQAWFARSGHSEATDPYFLYAASNAGSLLALFAYPFVIEPTIGLHAQSQLWGCGFALLTVLLLSSAALAHLRAHDATPSAPQPASTLPASVPTRGERLAWIGLAALPSALMVAVTTYIATDVVSVPLLWVIPLALYLMTFIIVFRDRELVPIALVSRALPLVFVAMLSLPTPGVRLALAFAGFVASAFVCHRELYDRRPSAARLTEFYLWMSLGGALGGIFSALVAPLLFPSAFEFTALMIIALFCRPDILAVAGTYLNAHKLILVACFAATALLANALAQTIGGEWGGRVVMGVVLAGLALALWRQRRHPLLQAGVMLAIGLFAAMLPPSQLAFYTARSFFGVVRVIDTVDGRNRLMQHGTTLHGSRRLIGADGTPLPAPVPATYYHRASPLARSVGLARRLAHGPAGGALRMGVVGLGTGSLACYTQPGDDLTYFEIDPVVARVAQDPRYFDFLSHCKPDTKIVLGDARLTLAKTGSTTFDLLVLDAFSSDSVPAHLLTTEALSLYLDKVAPRGLLAMHVSNRYLDLASSVVATAHTLPGVTVGIVDFPGRPDDADAQPSRVVFVARDKAALSEIASWPDGKLDPTSTASAWTDDYSDVLSALFRQLTSAP